MRKFTTRTCTCKKYSKTNVTLKNVTSLIAFCTENPRPCTLLASAKSAVLTQARPGYFIIYSLQCKTATLKSERASMNLCK